MQQDTYGGPHPLLVRCCSCEVYKLMHRATVPWIKTCEALHAMRPGQWWWVHPWEPLWSSQVLAKGSIVMKSMHEIPVALGWMKGNATQSTDYKLQICQMRSWGGNNIYRHSAHHENCPIQANHAPWPKAMTEMASGSEKPVKARVSFRAGVVMARWEDTKENKRKHGKEKQMTKDDKGSIPGKKAV